nr:integrase, catalytic region, zinc finger, CCHC-type, peptidase aspartic, catalytic [Tanacetum cinerariifolium]
MFKLSTILEDDSTELVSTGANGLVNVSLLNSITFSFSSTFVELSCEFVASIFGELLREGESLSMEVEKEEALVVSGGSRVATKMRVDTTLRAIMGYGDIQMGNILISRVYYVERLDQNLFSVGKFCDSNLEVAFEKHTCFVRNLEGVYLLSGTRDSNLYTILMTDMMKSSPIFLLSKASNTKS